MPLTVTLQISDAELGHFRELMRRVRERSAQRSPQEVLAAASAAVARLQAEARSPFIAGRIAKVRQLIEMLEDPEWRLPEEDRLRVLEALAYVAEANDLVPDSMPVLGLVDDAIMLELVLRELSHELEGYEEFDAYRQDEVARGSAAHPARPVQREDWLDERREALHERIRQRRERDLARDGEAFALITRF
jgi:uncharacterized membrane protein YkvA (DUF1232 family)